MFSQKGQFLVPTDSTSHYIEQGIYTRLNNTFKVTHLSAGWFVPLRYRFILTQTNQRSKGHLNAALGFLRNYFTQILYNNLRNQ